MLEPQSTIRVFLLHFCVSFNMTNTVCESLPHPLRTRPSRLCSIGAVQNCECCNDGRAILRWREVAVRANELFNGGGFASLAFATTWIASDELRNDVPQLFSLIGAARVTTICATAPIPAAPVDTRPFTLTLRLLT
jgi:hypothetical protein